LYVAAARELSATGVPPMNYDLVARREAKHRWG
jgi:hypothetical protein